MLSRILPIAFCFLLFAFSPSLLAAQDPPMKFGKIPKEDLEMKVYLPDTSAAAVVLCDYGTVAFDFTGEEITNILTRHKRIKILRRAGFEQGDVLIPFYPALMKVKNLEAQVFAPDGKKTELPRKDIFEEKINENWSQFRFAFPNLQEGCVVEYKYELETESIFELPEWYFQGEIPVRWSELRLTIPVFYQYVSITNGRSPDISETKLTRESVVVASGEYWGGGMVQANQIRLAMKELPGLHEEAEITTMDDYYARVRFQMKSYQYPNQDVEKVMGTWFQVAAKLLANESFGKQFTQKKNYKKAWEAAQSKLKADATPEEKMQALYKFVQTSIERQDGYPTFYAREDLDDLFEKKSASASEMNLLLVALLREAGLEAHPVLISTRDHGLPITMYPVLDQFNHVLALFENGDKRALLDAGNAFRPAGMIAINSLNREGWKVHAISPEWLPLSPSVASETYFGVFELDDEGTLKGKIQMSEEGYSAMGRRSDYHEKPPAEYWKTKIQKRYPDASLDSVAVENEDDPTQPLREKLNLTAPGYAQVSGDFIYVNPTFFSENFESRFKLERRNYPVDMAYPFKERIVCELLVPPGYKVESLPESARVSLANDGGRFQYIVRQNEQKISLNASINVTQLHFEPEEYEALRSFFGMIAEKYGEMVVLKKND